MASATRTIQDMRFVKQLASLTTFVRMSGRRRKGERPYEIDVTVRRGVSVVLEIWSDRYDRHTGTAHTDPLVRITDTPLALRWEAISAWQIPEDEYGWETLRRQLRSFYKRHGVTR